METDFLRGWNVSYAAMGGDRSETGWGRVGADITSAGTGGDGCIFYSRAGL